jgi:TRAP-type mannitol/chloroaromatic compound transport system permease small subunit
MKLADIIDRLNLRIGRAVAWLTLAMVMVMVVSVVQRYVFSATVIWQAELVRYCHAVIFMSAVGYTLLRDSHVRIDLFYQNYSDKKKALTNIIGTILFLFPVCISLIYFSWGFVINSWAIAEASTEYGGLPGVFLLKTFIWVFAILFILQGISTIIKSLDKLK